MAHTLTVPIEVAFPVFTPKQLHFRWSIETVDGERTLTQVSLLNLESMTRQESFDLLHRELPGEVVDILPVRAEFLALPKSEDKVLAFVNRWQLSCFIERETYFRREPELTVNYIFEWQELIRDLLTTRLPRGNSDFRLYEFPGHREELLDTMEEFLDRGFDARMEADEKSGKQTLRAFCSLGFLHACVMSAYLERFAGDRWSRCPRRDCGNPFRPEHASKKYCSWYCGHIESVRRGRERMRAALKAEKRHK